MRPYNAGGHFLKRRYHNGYKRRAATPLMPQQANQPLPDGYQLENYRISSVLSCGGFSIVYLAYDDNDHPNVVRVLNFFRANETVYMVMRYERGRTLQEHIQARRRGAVKESFIRHVFSLLLNGLREVHSNK